MIALYLILLKSSLQTLSHVTYLKNNKLGVIKSWVDRKQHYNLLARVAIRFLSIPASSIGSKRHFSHFKKIVSLNRNLLGENIITFLTFLKSV